MSGPMARVACGLPRPWLLRMQRGYRPDRSAEIQVVPQRPNFIGAGLPHVGPWDYTSHVPLFWYGPGYIKPIGSVPRPVTSADIAPTQARLLDFDFPAPDGEPMREGLVPAEDRTSPPRLIVFVNWDGAGRNVLAEWPESWRNLRRLRPRGAWYENAFVGSSPTSSAQIHGTFGTGAFPRSHGLVGHSMRVEGDIVSPWKTGPDLLRKPTLADLYDVEMDNRPLVGALGTVAIQLGMLGHGTQWEGGDRDLVVLREPGRAETLGAEGPAWNLPEHLEGLYRFPRYANDLPPLSSYHRQVDTADGRRDGKWRGHDFGEEMLMGGFQTPARIPYQSRLIEEVIERERFGADDVPDLLFVNFKLIDQIGHMFSLNSREMKDSVRAQDRYLPVLIDFLDEHVGEGRWVLTVTADHGSTPDPDVSGAFRISAQRLHAAIQEAFDGDQDEVAVVDQVKPTEIFINVKELEEHGGTLTQVSRHIMGLTQQETAIPGEPVPAPSNRVFQAAFPASTLRSLPCLPTTEA